MANLTKQEQSGRSMVEMLGVLAVIGVLSIAGVAGYTTAMNKHRANEILNGASVRAVVVSTQLQKNKDATPTLAEFGTESVQGVTFGTPSKVGDNQFQISLTGDGLTTDVCSQMKNIVGEDGIVHISDDCSKLTYNNDLSTGVTEATIEIGDECENDSRCVVIYHWDEGAVCVNGYCQVSQGDCPTGTFKDWGREECSSCPDPSIPGDFVQFSKNACDTCAGAKFHNDNGGGPWCYIPCGEDSYLQFVGGCLNISNISETALYSIWSISKEDCQKLARKTGRNYVYILSTNGVCYIETCPTGYMHNESLDCVACSSVQENFYIDRWDLDATKVKSECNACGGIVENWKCVICPSGQSPNASGDACE